MSCNCKNKRVGNNEQDDKSSVLERIFLFLLVLFLLPIILVLVFVFVFFKYLTSIIYGKDVKINIDWLYRLRNKYSKPNTVKNE